MNVNWENTLNSITDQSLALAILVLDGAERFIWRAPGQSCPLGKPEDLLWEVSIGRGSFRLTHLGAKNYLLYLVCRPDGCRCAFVYPFTCQLTVAESDALSLLERAYQAPSVSLDSLKALELPAYLNSASNETWQAEFLSLYSDLTVTSGSLPPSVSDLDKAAPPSLTRNDQTQPILPPHPEVSQIPALESSYWVQIV